MKKFIISAAVILALCFGNAIYGQPEPPDHGTGTNTQAPGGGAPIGEGLALLTALGVAYGYRKFKALKTEE